jgi:hypothetical protein
MHRCHERRSLYADGDELTLEYHDTRPKERRAAQRPQACLQQHLHRVLPYDLPLEQEHWDEMQCTVYWHAPLEDEHETFERYILARIKPWMHGLAGPKERAVVGWRGQHVRTALHEVGAVVRSEVLERRMKNQNEQCSGMG